MEAASLGVEANARFNRVELLAERGAVGLITLTAPRQIEIPWARQERLAGQAGMYLADAKLRHAGWLRFLALCTERLGLTSSPAGSDGEAPSGELQSTLTYPYRDPFPRATLRRWSRGRPIAFRVRPGRHGRGL